MSLPIDMTGKLAKINGDLNSWGVKINANELELADGINELYEDVQALGLSIHGGSATSTYLTVQTINGGGA